MHKSFIYFLMFFLFLGCSSYYQDSYKPDLIAEKKIQASRKGEIIKDNKPLLIAVATHLNEVDDVVYGNREYFFVEIFSEHQDVFHLNMLEFSLFKELPIWMREVKPDEYDEILNSTNKWSKTFLVAFEKLTPLASRNAKLVMEVYGLGKITFDFSYKALPFEL